MAQDHHYYPSAGTGELDNILSTFQALTGLWVVARTATGAPVEQGGSGEPSLCRLVHEAGCGAAQWRIALAGAAPPPGDLKARIFECSSGLIEGVVRLPAAQGEAEMITCGPILDSNNHPRTSNALIRRAAAHGIDPAPLRAALAELPVLPRARMAAAMDLLSSLLRWPSDAEGGSLQTPKAVLPDQEPLPIADLLSALRRGDRAAAQQRVQAALDAACPLGAEAGSHVRAQVIRLAVVLCSAAREGGVPAVVADDALLRIAGMAPAAAGMDVLHAVLREMLSALLRPDGPDTPWGATLAQRAAAFIETHYAEQLTLDEVAYQVHLSPSYFSALFKRERGIGFKRFLMEVRIAQAKKLLTGPVRTVEEVANAVGFEDVHYFTRVFTHIVGIPPGQFKRQRLRDVTLFGL